MMYLKSLEKQNQKIIKIKIIIEINQIETKRKKGRKGRKEGR